MRPKCRHCRRGAGAGGQVRRRGGVEGGGVGGAAVLAQPARNRGAGPRDVDVRSAQVLGHRCVADGEGKHTLAERVAAGGERRQDQKAQASTQPGAPSSATSASLVALAKVYGALAPRACARARSEGAREGEAGARARDGDPAARRRTLAASVARRPSASLAGPEAAGSSPFRRGHREGAASSQTLIILENATSAPRRCAPWRRSSAWAHSARR